MHRLLLPLALLLAALLPIPAGAASLVIEPGSALVGVGGRTSLDLSLVLGAGEEASVLEVRIAALGLGDTAGVVVLADGSSWDSCLSHTVAAELRISCTSQNTGGVRRVATLEITGLQPGELLLRMAAGGFAQQDTGVFPFLADLRFGPAPPTLLASVTVPEPAVDSLLGLALLTLTGGRRVRWIRRDRRSRLRD